MQNNVASKNISNVKISSFREKIKNFLSYLTSDELEGRDSKIELALYI